MPPSPARSVCQACQTPHLRQPKGWVGDVAAANEEDSVLHQQLRDADRAWFPNGTEGLTGGDTEKAAVLAFLNGAQSRLRMTSHYIGQAHRTGQVAKTENSTVMLGYALDGYQKVSSQLLRALEIAEVEAYKDEKGTRRSGFSGIHDDIRQMVRSADAVKVHLRAALEA